MFTRTVSLPAAVALALTMSCARTVQSGPTAAPGGRPNASAPVSAPAHAPAPSATAVADEIVTRTNAERRVAKLSPLARSAALMRAAEIQASQMARVNRLEHQLPGAAYPTLETRLAAVQYQMRAAGENIGEGYRTPAAAVAGWMASSGHRANMLSATYTEIGTAMAAGANGATYWVQVFGTPR